MSDVWNELESQNPSLAEARKSAELQWVPVAGAAPWADDAEVEACGMCKSPRPQRLADGRWIAGHYQPPECSIVLGDGDERQSWPLPAGQVSKQLRVAPSATRALVYATARGRGVLAKLNLENAALEVVDTGFIEGLDKSELAEIHDGEYVGDDDHMAVLVGSGAKAFLLLYTRTPEGWRETDNAKVNGLFVRSTGSTLVVQRERDCISFARVGDRLAKLSKLDHHALLVAPADTREVLWGHKSAGSSPHVLVGAHQAAQKKKARKEKKGTTTLTRFPAALAPVHASAQQMSQCFGQDWQRDGLRACGRSPAGRVLAEPAGGRLLVGHGQGAPLEVDTSEGYGLRSVHPRAERALVLNDKGQLAVLNLTSGSISSPIASGVYRAEYLGLAEDEAAIAVHFEGKDEIAIFFDPGRSALGEPDVKVDLKGAQASVAGGDLVLVRAGSKADSWDIERWPVSLVDEELRCAMDTQLLLPGTRYAKQKVMASTIAGVGVLCTMGKPRQVFALR